MEGAEGYATPAQSLDVIAKRRPDITLRQNIDGKIEQARNQVKALEDAKTRMESSGILDMRIEDIQSAMRW